MAHHALRRKLQDFDVFAAEVRRHAADELAVFHGKEEKSGVPRGPKAPLGGRVGPLAHSRHSGEALGRAPGKLRSVELQGAHEGHVGAACGPRWRGRGRAAAPCCLPWAKASLFSAAKCTRGCGKTSARDSLCGNCEGHTTSKFASVHCWHKPASRRPGQCKFNSAERLSLLRRAHPPSIRMLCSVSSLLLWRIQN